METQLKVHRVANQIALGLICLILMAAFYEQFALHELPCPLCLLQRVSLIALGLAICMNIRFGIRVAHYGLMLLTSLMGMSIAVRQILLHILPGDAGYGSPILGIHLYTWTAMFCFTSLMVISLSLLFDKAFAAKDTPKTRYFSQGLIAVFLLLILANMLGAFFECGVGTCPDDPVTYLFFDSK